MGDLRPEPAAALDYSQPGASNDASYDNIGRPGGRCKYQFGPVILNSGQKMANKKTFVDSANTNQRMKSQENDGLFRARNASSAKIHYEVARNA